jgi:hypothetical protein
VFAAHGVMRVRSSIVSVTLQPRKEAQSESQYVSMRLCLGRKPTSMMLSTVACHSALDATHLLAESFGRSCVESMHSSTFCSCM